ncbi:MAG: tetratricopeptide repeat protein [Phenylobacterium sp.]|uniref:tetratricopeptide repeat protein n=1 Tax=Phenylobacterium sp. TaxID=1871053 RepID=UPI0027309737|nr:tetratricopeptide repeat protein [Phenylobacterium sp.]MDP1619047.1 tetratricopeptide repeat protein [Phenylobacterium sp.]MDP1987186.1 tetratricopeptide repeat protein [Phenylobacterium sp.]MDP3382893.1 tetratricopeptide repeat protein [Phenylobacterium sp.]
MSRPGRISDTSAIALSAADIRPANAAAAADAMGVAGSKDALRQLNAAIGELRALSIEPILRRAVAALEAEDHETGGKLAIQALEHDERNGFAWYLLAIARERAGDFVNSITCYQSALALLPNQADVANDLGRLAFRMGMKVEAEKLFRHFLAAKPNHPEGANNLACAIRDQDRAEEAIAVLRPAIEAHPEMAMPWNTMGTIVTEQGDLATARLFYDEALRLQPNFPKAQYNRGNVRLSLGDAAGALADCDVALAGVSAEDERLMMRLSRSTALLELGRTAEGWDDYEARLHPLFANSTHCQAPGAPWTPETDLNGRSLLVFAEQGLGDEVMFANLIPDLIAALGPAGRLILAVEKRLVPLFQRSFPQAEVGAHATYDVAGRSIRVAPFLDEARPPELVAPLGSLLRRFRPSVDSFPAQPGYLKAAPERIAHWRQVLDAAPAGLKVGLLWKSALMTSARRRYFSAFEAWRDVLATPGVTFVNLQYGDCAAELEQARRDMGVEIWTPPGIDLKQDLDDIAALTCALDLVIGFPNATVNLAGACGASAWVASAPGAWPRLGSDHYPWYPQMRVFTAPALGDWAPMLGQMAQALAEPGGPQLRRAPPP